MILGMLVGIGAGLSWLLAGTRIRRRCAPLTRASGPVVYGMGRIMIWSEGERGLAKHGPQSYDATCRQIGTIILCDASDLTARKAARGPRGNPRSAGSEAMSCANRRRATLGEGTPLVFPDGSPAPLGRPKWRLPAQRPVYVASKSVVRSRECRLRFYQTFC